MYDKVTKAYRTASMLFDLIITIGIVIALAPHLLATIPTGYVILGVIAVLLVRFRKPLIRYTKLKVEAKHLAKDTAKVEDRSNAVTNPQ